MVLGSWVGDPLPVSFFFLLLFSVLFFIPYVRINARDGFGGSTLYASIPFLFFPLSLALVRADLAEAGVGLRIMIIIYSGNSRYEFKSFRDLARTSICSYLKAIFPIEIN